MRESCSSSLVREGLNGTTSRQASWLSCMSTITVAAQRWTHTSFHLYTLASGQSGYLDGSVCIRAVWLFYRKPG